MQTLSSNDCFQGRERSCTLQSRPAFLRVRQGEKVVIFAIKHLRCCLTHLAKVASHPSRTLNTVTDFNEMICMSPKIHYRVKVRCWHYNTFLEIKSYSVLRSVELETF